MATLANGATLGLKAAHSQFLAGDYTSALAAARRLPESCSAAVTETRALVRLGRANEARGKLDKFLVDACDQDDRARALVYAGWAAAWSGDHNAAATLCSRIDLHSLSPAIRSEIRYSLAAIAWSRGDYALADELVCPVLLEDPSVNSDIAGKAMILRGWLHSAREEYPEQMRATIQGIDLLRTGSEPDVGMIAAALQSLSMMAREFQFQAALDVVARLEPTIEWTADLVLEHFQVLRFFAWAKAINGDLVVAIPLWERARGLAKTSSTRLLAHLDRAWIAHLSGEKVSVRGELSIAESILYNEPLAGTGEEAFGLAYFAEVMAPYDPKRAREIFERSQTFIPRLDPGSGFRHDRRLGALLAFSEAVICEANGDKRTAKLRAEQAWEVFDHIGYVLRAARAALFLHRLSGDAKWLSRASKVRELYPNSFVTRELEMREKVGQNPIEALSRRQREVLTLLDRGLKIEHAATELGIEPGTLRVHVRKLHSIFQVHSRAQLLHKYAQLKSLG